LIRLQRFKVSRFWVFPTTKNKRMGKGRKFG